MMPKYIDAHCHPQFPQYDEDREALIEQMEREQVQGIVVGCDLDSSEEAVKLAAEYTHLYASVGLHPNHTQEVFDLEKYRTLAANPNVVAIGECGLDYFRPADANADVKAAQKELLQEHLTLARELDKPLIIHCRPTKGTADAYQDLIKMLKEEKKENPNLRGDIHFFVGGVHEARELIALGFVVSFTAVITFARDYDDMIRSIPLESILAETDSPYVAPASRRGQRNDPLSVKHVVEKIAEVRGEDPEQVRAALLANTTRVFSL